MEFLKSMPLSKDIYAIPPVFAGNDSASRWGLSKPLYGLPAARIAWYLTLRDYMVNGLGCNSTPSGNPFSSGKKPLFPTI